MATSKPVPLIPWNEKAPSLHVSEPDETESRVAIHFTLPHHYYVGSDLHCGCGFRNAAYQGDSWPEEEWRPEDDTSHLEAQPNHEKLITYLKQALPSDSSFELYGAWEADLAQPAMSDKEVKLSKLLDLDFYFRDRGKYRVACDG